MLKLLLIVTALGHFIVMGEKALVVRQPQSGKLLDRQIAMLNDYIYNEQTPTTLFFRSCWTWAENWYFYRNITSQTTLLKNATVVLPISVNPNKVMFLMDLDCPNSLDFIKNVN